MSPEQAGATWTEWARGPTSTACDATLYCLLTGVPPFEGDDMGTILRSVQAGQFQRASQLDPSLDRTARGRLPEGMSTQPDDRYPTAKPAVLADDLERWMADEPVSACASRWRGGRGDGGGGTGRR